MTEPRVSVVICTEARPEALALALTALRQQSLSRFEVVVVGDQDARRMLDKGDDITTVRFVENPGRGIADARNVGISAAAGEIIAFIDDDARPLPGWLSALIAPLVSRCVGATTGPVLGPDGLRLQHGEAKLDRFGCQDPAREVGARMLQGTNMAFRREALERLGGFDSRYCFGFDDTDISQRFFGMKMETAFVRHAEVVHVLAPSVRRQANRAPRDLSQFGAGAALFAACHASSERVSAVAAHRADMRNQLIRAMLAGRLMPGDVGRLLASFDKGARMAEALGPRQPLTLQRSQVFLPFALNAAREARAVELTGPFHRAAALRAEADRLALTGRRVFLRLTRVPCYRDRLHFRKSGVWEHHSAMFSGKNGAESPALPAALQQPADDSARHVAKAERMRETDLQITNV